MLNFGWLSHCGSSMQNSGVNNVGVNFLDTIWELFYCKQLQFKLHLLYKFRVCTYLLFFLFDGRLQLRYCITFKRTWSYCMFILYVEYINFLWNTLCLLIFCEIYNQQSVICSTDCDLQWSILSAECNMQQWLWFTVKYIVNRVYRMHYTVCRVYRVHCTVYSALTTECIVLPNQKFIVVATLRMVGNRWLWSIMLGNVNESRKSRVGYSRLPTEFLILETRLQATMIIVGISKCTQHVCESGRNSSHLRW